MNLSELERALRQLRLGGMAAVLETRLRQAQAEPMTPIDLLSASCRTNSPAAPIGCWTPAQTGRLSRCASTLDNFDFTFNPKMNRSLIFDLATGASSTSAKTCCFSDPVVQGRVTWHKPSDSPRFCKATVCCIAKRTCCSIYLQD